MYESKVRTQFFKNCIRWSTGHKMYHAYIGAVNLQATSFRVKQCLYLLNLCTNIVENAAT